MTRVRELGAFLRARRDALAPSDVGIDERSRRHVSGLRREEVAALAGIGTSWYAMVEQGRVDRIGRTTLERIATALRLSAIERAYVLALANDGELPAPEDAAARASLVRYVATVRDGAAFLTDHRSDVLGWNQLADAIFGFTRISTNNLLRLMVRERRLQTTFVDWDETLRHMVRVARLRAAPGADPELDALVRELAIENSIFAAAWNERAVATPLGHRCRLRDAAGVERAYDFRAFAPIDAPMLTFVLLAAF